jgi:hypothetical protein
MAVMWAAMFPACPNPPDSLFALIFYNLKKYISIGNFLFSRWSNNSVRQAGGPEQIMKGPKDFGNL